jgi:hypothetical protein
MFTVRVPATAGHADSIVVVLVSQSTDIVNGVCASAPRVRKKPETEATAATARAAERP